SDIDGTLEPTSVVFVNEPTGSTLSPDGKTLDVPGEGEYSIDPTTGEVTFTPEPDFDGTPTPIDYQVSDDDGGTATGTIEATITPTNDAPVLDLDGDDSTAPGADYANTFTEGGAPISVVDADVAISDIDDTNLESATVTFDNPQADDVLSIGSVQVFANGAIATPTITSGGITYDVSLGTNGEVIIALAGSDTLTNYESALEDITFENTSENPDTTDRTFTVSVNDGDAISNVATSTLSVADVNDPPIAVLDEVTTPEDTAVTFNPLTNDSDVDGTLDPTSVVFVNEPTGSTLSPDGKVLTVPDEGVYSIDPVSGEVTFTPEPDFNGTPTPVTYQVSDDDGDTVTAPIEVTVEDVNDPPIAVNDTVTTDEDTAITFNPLTDAPGEDSDIDGTLDPTSVVFVNEPAGSTLSPDSKTLTVPNEGEYTIDPATGEITFMPELNFNGPLTPVEYQVSDDDGDTATATVDGTVNDINDPPVAVLDEITTPEDTAVTFNPLTNDTDVDGMLDPTSVVFVNEPTGSTLSPDSKTLDVPDEGVYTIDPTTGEVTFTPEPDFDGTPTPVTYQVSDDDGDSATGTIEVSITPTNDAPVLDLDGDDSTTPGSDYAGTFTEGGAPVSIADSDIAITDLDDTNLESAIVTFTNPQTDDMLKIGTVTVFANGAVTTATVVNNGITYSVAPSINGEVVVSLAGSQSLADYQAAIGLIAFENTAAPIEKSDRIFTVSVNDGDTNSNVATTILRYDTDGDNIPDVFDLDDDNDGIPDTVEEATALNGGDTDGDGIPDTVDLDSDGDGLSDVLEAGGEDPDGDGTIGTGPITDLDNDGLDDSVDNIDAGSGPGEVDDGTPLPLPNQDGDGQPNFQDIDDDDDSVETPFENPDPNGDGNPDDAQDTDGDGTPDYLDIDDDNDGVDSEFENPDPNGDGNPDDAQDTDGDGMPDYLDVDDDNDGVDSEFENPDPNSDGNPDDAQDTDGDGTPDYLDVDDDNDGVDS
ncbi:MAG: tandem-95 repeat protein, partial [Cyanobacteria bacterium J06614_10]